jgi:hypothetical protein
VWFQERFGGGSKRMRKIGIVALARKQTEGARLIPGQNQKRVLAFAAPIVLGKTDLEG